MTAQMSESLVFEGKTHALCSLPLEQYFELSGEKPEFSSPNTACWRGYVGNWEVQQRRLYLIGFTGWRKNGSRITGTDSLFPGYPDRVFAHWFSDTLRVPQGRQLRYVHMGFSSEFEQDLLLRFRRGILMDAIVKVNGTANPGAPKGYGVAGFTTFSKPER